MSHLLEHLPHKDWKCGRSSSVGETQTFGLDKSVAIMVPALEVVFAPKVRELVARKDAFQCGTS